MGDVIKCPLEHLHVIVPITGYVQMLFPKVSLAFCGLWMGWLAFKTLKSIFLGNHALNMPRAISVILRPSMENMCCMWVALSGELSTDER